jgi:hypothetical protein
MGVADTRPSLRPRDCRGTLRAEKLGRGASRGCGGVSPRHCEERKRRSNPESLRRRILDCFASLAMTACVAVMFSPSCPAKAGHPVRRGVSAKARTSLEYWVALSRLRQGFDEAASSRARRSFREGGKPGDDSGVRGCLTIKSEALRTAQANATPRVNPSPSPPTRSPCASRRPSRRRSRGRTGSCRRGRRNHGWRRDRR